MSTSRDPLATPFPLLTERLLLRPFTRADLETFTAYRADPEIARYQSWSHYTREDAERFYAQQDGLAFNVDDSWFQIAVERRADGALLGDVAVHFIDEGRQAEMGVTFARDSQRNGYALEACARVIELLFDELGKHRITATVDADNRTAQRLLERQGFRREGEYRRNVYFKNAWSDEYGYALLHDEWRARHGR